MLREAEVTAQELGFERLGGISTQVYWSRERAEILKLAVCRNTDEREALLQSFRRCLATSRVYASEGLMPEVLEVGDDFAGTRCPYLRERYVAGKNLAEAYLIQPEYWDVRLPEELIRIYRRFRAGTSMRITASWDQNLHWHDELQSSAQFPRYAALHAGIREVGLTLRETARVGYLIHGDLQFGNILALEGERSGEVMLIDWQESDFWPIAFDFAMLYTFLQGPAEQVEEPLQPIYRGRPPLRRLWQTLASRLHAELGMGEELREFVIFRMGRGWLYKLDQALRAGDRNEANRWERAVVELIEGRTFREWPLPGSPS
jgi:Phosphotransferase enzyme family